MSNIISYQSLKLRLYPSGNQVVYLNKCFGATRFVYNYFLAERNKFYEEVIVALRKDFDYYKLLEKLQELQNKENKSKEVKLKIKELKILIEKIRRITNQEYKNYKELKLSELKEKFPFLKEANAQGLCNSYLNLKQAFSDFYSGKSEKPRFHSKKLYNSFKDSMMRQDFFDWNSKTVNLPKIGKIKFRNSILPKWYKNREKARIKLAKFEETVANKRRDWIEKESLRLVRNYKLIGVENLNIKGMMKGSRNAKNYLDISWSTFVSKLSYKSQFYDCQVIKVDRFFASSQICNSCGFKNKDVQTKHLENYVCPECGAKHQRDENAARNIAAEAYKVLREAEENLEKTSTESRSC